ncbi:MAG: hypothetical protein KIT74_03415 [Fimbriimonadales bacterium]|nr:hypothetical protein [Fimbriimonadales bacterium]
MISGARVSAMAFAMSAFVLTPPASAFDTWWHADATRQAAVGNGFSADARLTMQVTNYILDFYAGLASQLYDAIGADPEAAEWRKFENSVQLADPALHYCHFDAVFTTADVEANWKTLEANTIAALRKYAKDPVVKPGHRTIVLLTVLGVSLHIVQDFYSHSNWIDQFSASEPAPIWFDVPAAEREKLTIKSGAYPAGSAPGQPDHDTLNKDTSQRPGHARAFDVAARASVDWLRRIIAETPDFDWATLRGYDVSIDVVLRPFLREIDATFLTSSSIVVKHFDGEKPARMIFDQDPTRNYNKATTALFFSAARYNPYLQAEGNDALLPSPYWAGIKKYHVYRDIANGLILNGKRYQKPQ